MLVKLLIGLVIYGVVLLWMRISRAKCSVDVAIERALYEWKCQYCGRPYVDVCGACSVCKHPRR